MLTFLIVLLVLAALGMLPVWPYAAHWGYGYYPSSVLAFAVIVFIILLATGRIRL